MPRRDRLAYGVDACGPPLHVGHLPRTIAHLGDFPHYRTMRTALLSQLSFDQVGAGPGFHAGQHPHADVPAHRREPGRHGQVRLHPALILGSRTLDIAFVQYTAEAGESQWREVAGQLRPTLPRLAALMQGGLVDIDRRRA